MPTIARDLDGVQRTRPARRHQHELARVVALAHRVGLDGVDHVVHGHRDHAERGLLERSGPAARPRWPRSRAGDRSRSSGMRPPRKCLGAQAAEHDVGVGHRRLECRRGRRRTGPGSAPGALRADLVIWPLRPPWRSSRRRPRSSRCRSSGPSPGCRPDRGVGAGASCGAWPAGGHADVRRGAAHVQRDRARRARCAAPPSIRPGGPTAGPESNEVDRRLAPRSRRWSRRPRTASGAGHAAARRRAAGRAGGPR